MIYFDNSSTTPMNKDVIKAMTEVMEKYFGNPSSLHNLGFTADKLMKQARGIVADTLKVEPNEIIFTSGGSESDNFAIKGIAKKYKNRGRHIITTQIEHPAVLETCKALEEEGFEISYLTVDDEGRISLEEFERKLRKDTILVSVMHVNNEVGTIQPLEEISRIIKANSKAFFHVDGVQGFLKVPLDIEKFKIDAYSISGHKINGPKGVGILYLRKGINIEPLIHGGGQERNLRAGTENLAGIVGIAKAIQISREIAGASYENIAAIRLNFIEKLKAELPGIKVNGSLDAKKTSPYIVNLGLPNFKGENILHALEKKDIYVSTGSACSSKEKKFSHVLGAMRVPEEYKMGSIRLSFSYDLREKELDIFIDVLKDAIGKLKI